MKTPLKLLFTISAVFLVTSFISGQNPRLVLPIGHTDDVTAAQFSPDGKFVLTFSKEDQSAKVWDAISGYLLFDALRGIDTISTATFTPDGKKILIGYNDGTIQLYDFFSGNLLYQLDSHKGKIYSIGFSPDKQKIITSSADRKTKIWELRTGQLLSDLSGHSGKVYASSFSSDGKYILTGSQDHTAKIWDARTGKELRTLNAHSDNVFQASFSPDAKLIVTVGDDKLINVWDAETKLVLYTISKHKAAVNGASFSPDSKLLLSYSDDSTAKIWSSSTGKLLLNLKSDDVVNAAEFNTEGNEVLTSSGNGEKVIWDIIDRKVKIKWNAGYDFNNGTLSLDGQKIVSPDYDGAEILIIGTKKIIELKGHTSRAGFFAMSPDGNQLLTSCFGSSTQIWDIKTGQPKILSGKSHLDILNIILHVNFSPDGKMASTSSFDGSVKIWNTQNATLLQDLPVGKGLILSSNFNMDGTMLSVTSAEDESTNEKKDKNIKIWSTVDGKLLQSFSYKSGAYSGKFVENSSKLITNHMDGAVIIWDIKSGKLLKKIIAHSAEVFSMIINPYQDKFVTTSQDSIAKCWEIKTGNLLFQLKGHSDRVNDAKFNADGSMIATSSDDHTAKIWDSKSGKLLVSFIGHNASVMDIEFSPDNKRLLTASADKNVYLWDIQTGNKILGIETHKARVHFAKFSPDGKLIITASADNTCKIWNSETGQLIYTFFALDNLEYFTQIPSGYYRCSPNAARLLYYVTKDLNVISFEQLDVKYNRPDKIVEAIGNTDTLLIRSYKRAHEKRIKRLGVDTTTFRDGYSIPIADFVNRNDIAYEQKDDKLLLHIKAFDSTYLLDQLNIWINEIPLYSQRGIDIREKSKKQLDTTISIILSNGENRIEMSVRNLNGTESYRIPLVVNYTPATEQKERIYFVGIGIDSFSSSSHNLAYSTKDIRDLASKLKQKFDGNISIDTLFNENVSVTNVKRIKQRLQQSSVNDKVIIAYSGHGLLSKDFDYYLSTYSINFDNPEQNGLPYEDLEDLLDSIPARKKLLLIDACHSGEVDKEDLQAINNTADSLQLKGGLKSFGYKKERHLGLKNSFELMQSLFVNVKKSTGATVISAAAGTQFALEKSSLKNGVFTYAILEAMNANSSLSITELKKVVIARVVELTNGMQVPTFRNETAANDWRFW